jgi:uroporphyrinogen-III decarboxylase
MEVLADTKELLDRRYTLKTPHGDLTWSDITRAGTPTQYIERPIKDLDQDWPKLAWWLQPTKFKSEFSVSPQFQGTGLGGPGWCLPISWWEAYRHGNMTAVTFDIATQPEKMDEIFQWYRETTLIQLDALLAARPREALDEITIQGSSSSLSYSSLDFFKEYDLPWLKEVTRRTKAAGVLTHLHVCGRSWQIVELVYGETDVDLMEPIEPPPGGNVDLAEAKRRFGDKLAFKGNLNTFNLLTYGKVEEVREAAKRCLEAAMEGGGFWLATGDQTPANAPEENLIAVIETAREYGKY